jgi:hypothetical protein
MNAPTQGLEGVQKVGSTHSDMGHNRSIMCKDRELQAYRWDRDPLQAAHANLLEHFHGILVDLQGRQPSWANNHFVGPEPDQRLRHCLHMQCTAATKTRA